MLQTQVDPGLTDRSSSWLVDDSKDGETSDSAGVLGSRTLGVVEVCQVSHWTREQGTDDSHAGTVTTA